MYAKLRECLLVEEEFAILSSNFENNKLYKPTIQLGNLFVDYL